MDRQKESRTMNASPNGCEKGCSIETSPLWRLSSKSKLATLLGADPATLRRLKKEGGNAYRCFSIAKKNGKKRPVQNPVPELKALQIRLNSLLQRIEYPEYVQAGLKGKTYIRNAEYHQWDTPVAVATVDIKDFYPSCRRSVVEAAFRRLFELPFDVAQQLAGVATYNDHLPTGGPASLLLSFWAYKDVFDQIWRGALNRGFRFSLYVDDMTFSGSGITGEFIYGTVLRLLRNAGLIGHKIKLFKADCAKEITGSMVVGGQILMPKSRYKDIANDFKDLKLAESGGERLKILHKLISRLHSAVPFQTSCGIKAMHLQQERLHLLRKLPKSVHRIRNGQTLAIARERLAKRREEYLQGKEETVFLNRAMFDGC